MSQLNKTKISFIWWGLIILNLLTRDTKLVLKFSSLLKHLNTVVVGVCNNDVFLGSQTKTMRRVKLPLPWTQLSKLAPIHKTSTHMWSEGLNWSFQWKFQLAVPSFMWLITIQILKELSFSIKLFSFWYRKIQYSKYWLEQKNIKFTSIFYY